MSLIESLLDLAALFLAISDVELFQTFSDPQTQTRLTDDFLADRAQFVRTGQTGRRGAHASSETVCIEQHLARLIVLGVEEQVAQ